MTDSNTLQEKDRVGVLVIHGMGKQPQGFSKVFEQSVRRRLVAEGKHVAWQEARWAHVLDTPENEMIKKLRDQSRVDWLRAREFVISYFADAIAYQRKEVTEDGTTVDNKAKIHECIAKNLVKLRGKVVEGSPLIVVAHSMGSVIFSDLTWDRTKVGGLAFEDMATLGGIITFGSNLPLFTLGLPNVRPIQFPGKKLDEALVPKARWLNFYDPDDVLGYPLVPFYDYPKKVLRDITTNSGPFYTSWNPGSHAGYWEDEQVIAETAKLIQDMNPMA